MQIVIVMFVFMPYTSVTFSGSLYSMSILWLAVTKLIPEWMCTKRVRHYIRLHLNCTTHSSIHLLYCTGWRTAYPTRHSAQGKEGSWTGCQSTTRHTAKCNCIFWEIKSQTHLPKCMILEETGVDIGAGSVYRLLGSRVVAAICTQNLEFCTFSHPDALCSNIWCSIKYDIPSFKCYFVAKLYSNFSAACHTAMISMKWKSLTSLTSALHIYTVIWLALAVTQFSSAVAELTRLVLSVIMRISACLPLDGSDGKAASISSLRICYDGGWHSIAVIG